MIYTPLRDGRAVEQGSQGGERAGVTWRGSWAFAGWGTENLGTPHLKTAGLSPHARLRQLPPLRLPRPFGHPLPSPVLDEDAPHAALVSPRSSLHVLSSFPWGARALSRCQADAGLSSVSWDLQGERLGSCWCRGSCPSVAGNRLLPLTGGAAEARRRKVTFPRSPGLLGLPRPQRPLLRSKACRGLAHTPVAWREQRQGGENLAHPLHLGPCLAER